MAKYAPATWKTAIGTGPSIRKDSPSGRSATAHTSITLQLSKPALGRIAVAYHRHGSLLRHPQPYVLSATRVRPQTGSVKSYRERLLVFPATRCPIEDELEAAKVQPMGEP